MSTNSSTAAVSPFAPAPQALESGPGYFVAGAGAPVVMLHASLGSKAQWSALAARLAPRFRVIALDLLGYGDNTMPEHRASFDLDDEIRLVSYRLDRLIDSQARVHLVGHSYGALVALRFAQCRSRRTASLSIYEPVAFRLLDDDDAELAAMARRASRLASLIDAGRGRDAAEAFVDFWSGSGHYAALSPPVQWSIARRVPKLPLDFQAALSWPLDPEDLRTIVAPTLLLSGDRSPAVTQRIRARLASLLPVASVGYFDTGHMGPVTDADRINLTIEAFLDVQAKRQPVSVSSATALPPAA